MNELMVLANIELHLNDDFSLIKTETFGFRRLEVRVLLLLLKLINCSG